MGKGYQMIEATQALATLTITEPSEVRIPKDETLANLPTYYDRLKTVTHLFIEMPLTPDHFIPLVKLANVVQVIDVALHMTCDLPLSVFLTCSKLQELSLRGKDDADVGKVVAFPEKKAVTTLTSLTIINAQIVGDFLQIPSAFEKLQYLCLERSHLHTAPYERHWKALTSLSALNLKGTLSGELDPWPVSSFKGLVCSLQRQMPLVAIVAKEPESSVDRTHYQGVLSSQKMSRHCYSLDDLQNKRWTETSLDRLLFREGWHEDNNWKRTGDFGSVFTHNVCELYGASPIKCLDNRTRIAAEEPEEGQYLQFWKYILDNDVSVIVMVKEMNKKGYFPQNKDDSVKYDDNITVSCTSCDIDPLNKSSKRKFQINDKTVYQIQLDWVDGHGITLLRLLPFLQTLGELEKANPGKTVIHCMSGYGRTGTVFACLLLKQLMDKAASLETLIINLEELVRALRQQRYGMIAFGDQLITVLEFALHYWQEKLREKSLLQEHILNSSLESVL